MVTSLRAWWSTIYQRLHSVHGDRQQVSFLPNKVGVARCTQHAQPVCQQPSSSAVVSQTKPTFYERTVLKMANFFSYSAKFPTQLTTALFIWFSFMTYFCFLLLQKTLGRCQRPPKVGSLRSQVQTEEAAVWSTRTECRWANRCCWIMLYSLKQNYQGFFPTSYPTPPPRLFSWRFSASCFTHTDLLAHKALSLYQQCRSGVETAMVTEEIRNTENRNAWILLCGVVAMHNAARNAVTTQRSDSCHCCAEHSNSPCVHFLLSLLTRCYHTANRESQLN